MTTTNINLPYITADATGTKHLDMTLTRAKFDELTADPGEADVPRNERFRLETGKISKILLSAVHPIPAVQNAVQRLDREPFKGINPDECAKLWEGHSSGCSDR